MSSVKFSKEESIVTEGCLSVPGLLAPVQRSEWVDVQYETMAGEVFRRRFGGLEGRIFQHEFDHLEGLLFIHRLDKNTAEEIRPFLEVLEAGIGRQEPSSLI